MQNPQLTGGFTIEKSHTGTERYLHGTPPIKNFKLTTLRDSAFWRIFRSDKQEQHTHSQITEQLELNFKQGD